MDTFKTIVPKDKDLLKCIAYYYFHESKDEHFSKDIVYHPHYLVALNVYSKVKIQWNENGKTYLPIKSDAKEVILTINNKTSKEVRLRGAFNKIGVVFNPLGINHFINYPLNKLVENNRASNFDYFGDDFLNTSRLVFNEPSLVGKGNLLDSFFKNYFKEFEDKRVTKAIDLIFNSSKMPKTQELADCLDISRKTLLRLFKMHLCFSVEEFKSVVKFRRALLSYEEAINKPELSHVAYDNEYYDQSDFINHFKSITGLNPSKFFSSINNISNNGTYWTFKKD
ncbi:helix-turn-helix domain-containing protein [uncultured Croceitalea sp.]|uniref:helix-turn-helix domain-containing protein n=1 Tax=uncultured Croceitalea sp. TaxID=1798908 RepID=UPI003305E9F7